MKPWAQRPFESRNLFNPAFCGVILLRAMLGYQSIDPKGMPFSMSLLVLPLCLHKETRNVIIAGKLSYLTKIVEDHPHILVGFPDRTRSLFPYTLEALGLLMERETFNVQEKGKLVAIDRPIKNTITGTVESKECQSAARALGKKLATLGDRVTVYTILGIRP